MLVVCCFVVCQLLWLLFRIPAASWYTLVGVLWDVVCVCVCVCVYVCVCVCVWQHVCPVCVVHCVFV